jgi:hypothetical protein
VGRGKVWMHQAHPYVNGLLLFFPMPTISFSAVFGYDNKLAK